MSREGGQADLNAFQVRIYIDENEVDIKTVMTIEVEI